MRIRPRVELCNTTSLKVQLALLPWHSDIFVQTRALCTGQIKVLTSYGPYRSIMYAASFILHNARRQTRERLHAALEIPIPAEEVS